MNRVRNRLAALFFVITAAAIGFVYLYVVPQLRSSLTSEKLDRLEQSGARATRGGNSCMPTISRTRSSRCWSVTPRRSR